LVLAHPGDHWEEYTKYQTNRATPPIS